MIHPAIAKILEKNKRAQAHPEFREGDTIKVHVKIKEGDKERTQIFEGVVIAFNNSGMSKTITVRKISFGHGVERIFPIHAPVIEKVELVRKGEVRRANLYSLRDLRGKAAKIRERRAAGDLETIYSADSEVAEVITPSATQVEEVAAEVVTEEAVTDTAEKTEA